jgi:type III restriction enzyme
MFKGGKTVIVPPVETTRIQALPNRIQYEITFPQLTGYRVESAEKTIVADFSKISPYPIDGSKYPSTTDMASAFLAETHKLTLDQVHERREQELIYVITRYMIDHYYMDDEGNRQFQKFAQIKDIVSYWIRYKTRCIGDAFLNMLFYEDPKSVCDHIMLGVHAEQRKHDRILPIFNHYNKFGSTKYVNNNTSKKVYQTKKSHVNYVVADTDSWEQIAAKTLEEMPEVFCYVKNIFLNFFIPYSAYGKDSKYIPDFIARIKSNSGKMINLIIEISGFSHDKEAKKQFVENRWLPAVNNVLDKYEMDEWYFLEIANEISDIKNDIRNFIKSIG